MQINSEFGQIDHFRITQSLSFKARPGAQPIHMKMSFNLHVNEISFSYERMSTKTRFEKEAKGNSKMVYCLCFAPLRFLSMRLI